MRLITFTPKTAPTSAPRAGALLPGDESVLNFSVAVDASADVPLAAWFDLDDEWLPKVRQIHDSIVKNAARVETLPRGSVLSRANARIGPPVPRRAELPGSRCREQHAGPVLAGHVLEVRDVGDRAREADRAPTVLSASGL
jgi:hypothetical protein